MGGRMVENRWNFAYFPWYRKWSGQEAVGAEKGTPRKRGEGFRGGGNSTAIDGRGWAVPICGGA